MNEDLVRLLAPASVEWRIVRFVLTIPLLFVGWLMSMRYGVPHWLAISAIGAALLALDAALRDDTETWVRPDGLTVRRRNLFCTRVQTIPTADVKGIGICSHWLAQILVPQEAIRPPSWRVVIDTASYGRLHSGAGTSERDAAQLEMRVRHTLGW